MGKTRIIKQWVMTKIDPKEIANALRGTLKKSSDNDSEWDIYLAYGKWRPRLLLKLHIKKRNIFVAVPAPVLGNGAPVGYRCTVKLANVEDLRFVRYWSFYTKKQETDISIRVRNSGKIDAEIVVSSFAHRTFE